jgi:hypothetical protein
MPNTAIFYEERIYKVVVKTLKRTALFGGEKICPDWRPDYPG